MSNQALVLQSPGLEGLAVEEREIPKPGPGEAVVRLQASCLNYHDFVVLKGLQPSVQYPRVPLSDGAGQVVAVGDGVARVSPGDRVCANFYRDWVAGPPQPQHWASVFGDAIDGCAQQYLQLPAEALSMTPAHLSDLEAATLPCAGVTAWASLERAGLRSGETVLVQGTGGVSIFGLQLAKARGCRVIVTSSSHAKLERARELGADETIHYLERPDWDEAARELTNGRGVDLTIDVGGEQTLGRAIAADHEIAGRQLLCVVTGLASAPMHGCR